jgi:LuxR family maltose regulon positive regulatory protein
MANTLLPLLETKIHPPRRRGALARPRLRERLDQREQPPLTLVSAPAGFGKSTLVAQWFADEPTTVWLSLDSRDNDPVVFWTYVLAALDVVAPGAGLEARELLDAAQPPLEVVVATLVNGLNAVAGDIVLVLDDYHVIESVPIHDSMAFLVEHLPSNVHLVIASRADPPLPLAALRARGELLEVRAADLRFTTDEAAAYLNESMGLTLTSADVEALEARTEGWVAALQLAALSLQGRDDSAGFIASFAGDDRFILDYLVGEVLDRQTDDVRQFLLQTSILDRLTGPLCDAVTGGTGGTGGKAMLDRLDRANLFLVALDDRRNSYRYHHLFADVLRAHLLDESPDLVPELHRRASTWSDANGDQADAVAHALAGRDVEGAARLIELAAPAMRQSRQEATLRAWLEALPDDVFRTRPVLCLGLLGARMATGDPTGVEALLDQAEAALDPANGPCVVFDEREHIRLPAQIAVHRAGIALLSGDVDGALGHATRALELCGPDDHLPLGSATALVALAQWATGDLVTAEPNYRASIDHLLAAGHLSDALGCSLALADIQLGLGRLGDAQATFELGLRRTVAHPGLRGAADMHVGLAEVLLDRADLDGAARELQTAAELGERAGLPQNPYRCRVATARLRIATDDLDGALDALDEAEPLYDTDFSPPVRPVSALRARVQVAQGDLDAARRWADGRGLRATDELSYVREYEHVTLARILLARHRADGDADALEDAVGLLERLLAAAEEGQRLGSANEIRHLLATAQEAAGATTAVPSSPALVDGLSARELDVLRLLRSDLSGPDIASELYISLNTFRTHTKNIYAKLGVNNRREAVRRAGELGL